MSVWTLPLLPSNGLDRSLHAPVLVGLVFVTLFTEVFGWTYAGLVVPGYLAAAFAAAPITGVLILIEGGLTHIGVALVARVIPERTGAWSTAFGRERFFLYIVVAIVIRLFIEGSVVPWATYRYHLTHSRELYSIGLVLVPLIANVFWSSGIYHAGPRLLVLTGLTYLVVDVLLQHTNFSLSRFQVANESVALHFLDTPKAYLLLLVGAMLGARGNVRYGWDYNGILVPALLAVAWYEPVKLLGTAVEAVALYLLARFLSSVRPFSRLPLVGPRRMLFVGILGFAFKLGLGHLLLRTAPSIQLTEYLGFGYILPSLLAVKMWNKLRIGIVLMPTLQVSLTAFLFGNALGFGLNWLTEWRAARPASSAAVRMSDNIAFDWLLASHVPPQRPGECRQPLQSSALRTVIEQWLQRGFPTARELGMLDAAELEVVSDQQRWWLIAPKATATPACSGLRVALSPDLKRRGGALALRLSIDPYGSALTAAALAVAEATAAPLVLGSVPSDAKVLPSADDSELLPKGFSILELDAAERQKSVLTIIGTVPNELNLGALEQLTRQSIQVDFADARQMPNPRLTLGDTANRLIASQRLGTAELEQWSAALRRELQSRLVDLIGQTYRAPSQPELLLLSSTVLPALESDTGPNEWVRAVALHLGYRIAQSPNAARTAWVLFEPPDRDRRGNATWIVRPGSARHLTVEVPAPLWEHGTLSYGLSLFDALDARHLMVAGVRPNAKPDGSSDPRRSAGKTSFFQRIHETALARGEQVLAIHAIRPDVPITEDVIAESSAPVLSPEQRPSLALEVFGLLARSGLSAQHYQASTNQVSIGAQFDPAFAFAERFAPDGMLRLWFSQRAREQISSIPAALDSFRRIIDRSPLDVDVAKLTLERLGKTPHQRKSGRTSAVCDLDRVTEQVEQWLARNNPYDRLDAKRLGLGCEWHASIDAPTGIPWLLLVSSNAAHVVPMHSAKAVARRVSAEASAEKIRAALDLGTATVVVEAP